jgi:hypothetical protein
MVLDNLVVRRPNSHAVFPALVAAGCVLVLDTSPE